MQNTTTTTDKKRPKPKVQDGMYVSPKGIRGLDLRTWTRFKARALLERKTVGEAMNEAMQRWLRPEA